MDATLSVILLSWSWRPEIILSLVLAAAVHLAGRWQLKQRGGGQVIAPWRTAAYLSGLAILWIALMSPIDVLSSQYFFMHMIQHLLMVMFAAPLLLIGNPMPIMLWGLPSALRLEVGRWLRPAATFRRVVAAITRPGLAWLYFVIALVGWHDPNAYNATLESDIVHDLEHISFFITAVLFWWHITGVAPHIHKKLSKGARIGYTVAAVPPNALTGIAISFASEPIYAYYESVPRLGSMTVMQDQMLAGTIMWIPGSMMYFVAVLILVVQVVRDEEEKAALPGYGQPPGHATDAADSEGPQHPSSASRSQV
ncbi:MAG: cytochrome c oxidase assembly protein [Anaerolineae bacterium]|nr:cytochrome c oxidase assembly protein [Anaerolineae bacterium]